MKKKVLPYNKIKELRKAASEGNAQAKAIIDKYMDDGDIEEIESMVSSYYGNKPSGNEEKETVKTTEKFEDLFSDMKSHDSESEDDEYEWNSSDGIKKADEKSNWEKKPEEKKPEEKKSDWDKPEEKKPEFKPEDKKPEEPKSEPKSEESKPEDKSLETELKQYDFSALDGDFKDLIDEDEVKEISFGDFLKDKKKNRNRERKNSDYFKAYDQGERDAYSMSKKDEYGKKFDSSRNKLDRAYRDNGKAIDEYSRIVTSFPMEDGAIDMESSSKAYGEFTDNESAMGAFGRIWDADDTMAITNILTELANKYGKRNVISMLNSLKQDNEEWKAFGNGKMDDAIGNYGKSLDKLLK